MDKRKRQRYAANTKAALILVMVAAVAYCAGMLVGYCYAPPNLEILPLYIEEPKETEEQAMEAAVIQNAAPEETTPALRYHGLCRITAYCSCQQCCGEWANDRPVDEEGNPIVYGASGIELTPGVSVACSLPYGTEIMIDGLPGTYIVEDRTAEWVQDKYNGMTVDIYMDSHEACYELLAGLPEWMDVYIVEE